MTVLTAKRPLVAAFSLYELVCHAWRALVRSESTEQPRDGAVVDDESGAERSAFLARVSEVLRHAMDAQNGPRLRQALAEVALSTAYAELDVEMATQLEASDGGVDGVELPDTMPQRLGEDAATLFLEALQLLHAIVAMTPDLEGQIEVLPSIGAQGLARLRHDLVLGDVVPPRVSQAILASLRGTVALLGLAGAAVTARRVPEWKAVSLGEAAVDGMKALRALATLDLRLEAEAHARWKDEIVARLERGESGDVDEGTPRH